MSVRGLDGAAQGSGRVIRLIARREIVTRTRSRAFRITTGLFVLGIGAMVLLTSLTGGSSASRIAFTAVDFRQAATVEAAARSLGENVEVRAVADRAVGERAVLDGDVDAFVRVVATPGAAGNAVYRVVVKKELGDRLTSVLSLAARQVALERQVVGLGGDPAVVGRAVSAATVQVSALRPASERDGARLLLGLLSGGLIYLSLLIFGPAVAQGVIEEKSSRVVELLLATVRPWQLMAGKVIGIGAVALGQLTLIGVVGVSLGLTTGQLDIPAGIAIGSVALALLWYLLGFAVYALLFAAAGALVSRQEDAGGVTAPMILLIVVPYVLGISVLPGSPDSGLILALAMIPLFAPVLMPMVIGIGSVAGWQVVVAMALTLALIGALVWLAGRVYGNAVKRGGTRVSIREALGTSA
ncbi:ABC transporter permease [Frankia sp. CcI156]|uniref:ABC transporter permease n=1 Tax=Frankia casuarinae (strain DSM 45818 / CECT 9043 / HFP020203 / CcI3) TaxID=106370 RepID=Q2J9S9_FRACC|nr:MULTISPECIES: ABC transporter permease [Frankia]ABD11963.1 putative ABC transporter permease [Frankia casuarinae]ETA01897.1 ABC-type Na+ efflux pump, permease component [Frankia sp. CcI6]EYT92493.1 ABC-type Na+ efflux pump, permease component [Frankia casuarinae]OFB39433.1 ABC transporter permease [Frankia sp. CgIM4]OHV53763.1 ABC transporter permease [Frankia sp. CgIS1]